MTTMQQEDALRAGQTVQTRRLMGLPVGSVFRGVSSGHIYTVLDSNGLVERNRRGTSTTTDTTTIGSFDSRRTFVIVSIPEQPDTFTEGAEIDWLRLTALPVGSVIEWRDRAGTPSTAAFRVDEDQQFYRLESSDNVGIGQTIGHGALARRGWTLRRLPGPHVGDQITERQVLWDLPIGAQVTYNNDWTYTKIEDHIWRRQDLADEEYNDRHHFVLTGENVITFLPPADGTVETLAEEGEIEEVFSTAETLRQFKHRLWTVAWAHCQSAGVSLDPLPRIFEALEVEQEAFAPGTLTSQADYQHNETLPRGTTVEWGTDPSRYGEYVLYGWNGSHFEVLAGGARVSAVEALKIKRMPGAEERPEWIDATPSIEEQREVEAYKRRVWELGLKAKADNSWCGEYERAMAKVGITGQATGPEVEYLDAEAVAALPEGTILRVVRMDGGSVWLRRDDECDNPCRTRRIGGTIGGSWAAAQVQHFPNGHAPIHSHREMSDLPLGVIMTNRSGYRWTKTEGDRWTGGHPSNAFDFNGMTYVLDSLTTAFTV